jgi:hypothetical protein
MISAAGANDHFEDCERVIEGRSEAVDHKGVIHAPASRLVATSPGLKETPAMVDFHRDPPHSRFRSRRHRAGPHADPPPPSYVVKIAALRAAGLIPDGKLSHIGVYHEDHCRFERSLGPCNCDADVRIIDDPPGDESS